LIAIVCMLASQVALLASGLETWEEAHKHLADIGPLGASAVTLESLLAHRATGCSRVPNGHQWTRESHLEAHGSPAPTR
jgi:hypothetical protein